MLNRLIWFLDCMMSYLYACYSDLMEFKINQPVYLYKGACITFYIYWSLYFINGLRVVLRLGSPFINAYSVDIQLQALLQFSYTICIPFVPELVVHDIVPFSWDSTLNSWQNILHWYMMLSSMEMDLRLTDRTLSKIAVCIWRIKILDKHGLTPNGYITTHLLKLRENS